MGRIDWTEPQCLYSTSIQLLSLWSVRSYRASVSVQYRYTSCPPMDRTACTEPQCLYSTAIHILPLWAVRPVQSLSACTVQLYLYSPYGPYGLYRVSVPVQGCTLPFTLLVSCPLSFTMCFCNTYHGGLPCLSMWHCILSWGSSRLSKSMIPFRQYILFKHFKSEGSSFWCAVLIVMLKLFHWYR